ncbi:hypothetical protein [Catenulispora pinisilvae]|nr:hypothetical protein [Catenulispora pinisilvae]
MPAVATGAGVRTAGLRLCHAHARRLANGTGPHTVIRDPSPDPHSP